jgi:4'-phosphopantetheinyl transferase EntD
MAELAPPVLAWSLIPVEDHSGSLFPEERALIPKAVARRVRTFSSGRVAARLALARAGWAQPSEPILACGRAPLAPAGWRLSISHTDDLALAVACRAEEAAGLGVDIERIDRMQPGMARHIVHAEDRFAPNAGALELTVAFSLRESLFKALAAQDQQRVKTATLRWEGSAITAELVPPLPHVQLRHDWRVAAGHVVTLATRVAG